MHAFSHRLLALLVTAAPLTLHAQMPPAPPTTPLAPALPPAQLLPPVNVPSTPTPETALPPTATNALPPTETPSTAEEADLLQLISQAKAQEGQPQSSMGRSRISVFFSPIKIRAVADALAAFESRSVATAAPAGMDENFDFLQTVQEAPKVTEPDTYPVFYLSSIVFRASDDWSIWVSGHKITSKKNTTDLEVVSVTPNQASMIWRPTFKDALAARAQRNLFAPTDPVKNKLTTPASYRYDEEAGVVHFTLRPNQSFVAGYMNTFEGFIESPKLEPLEKKENEPKAGTPTAGANELLPANAGLADKVRNSRSEINKQLQRRPATP